MDKCFVYVIECRSVKPYPVKIGVSTNPANRIAELQTGNPYPLILIASIPFNSRKTAYEFESFAHKGNKKSSVGGEWFDSKKLNLNRSIRAWNSFKDERFKATKESRTKDAVCGSKQERQLEGLRNENKSLRRKNKQLKQDIEDYLDSKIDLYI
jgi:predicted GIY-YIG superfamily endonuclease